MLTGGSAAGSLGLTRSLRVTVARPGGRRSTCRVVALLGLADTILSLPGPACLPGRSLPGTPVGSLQQRRRDSKPRRRRFTRRP